MAGPFYFAWVPVAGTPFAANTHAIAGVHDIAEELFELEIEHSEGDFPSLRLDVRNPQVGLIAPGRSLWCWLSWDRSALRDRSDLVPLFHGRIVGVPEDLQNEIVRLMFIARPPDYEEQRQALAATLRVAPYWDAAWLNEDRWDDVDAVLEARTQLWHIDRITHAVTVSDLLNGEDGTAVLTESDHFYDAMSVTYGEAPVRRVHVEALAQWTQYGAGEMSLHRETINLIGGPHFDCIASFSGDGLSGDWPKREDDIGGGWQFGETSIKRIDGERFSTRYQKHEFTMDTVNEAGVVTATSNYIAWFPLWEFSFSINVKYEAKRQKYEVMTFDVFADTQNMLTEIGEEEIITLKPKSVDLSTDALGSVPIGDVRRRAYFPTDRGKQSIDYLVTMARAHLLMRARAVEVKIQTEWDIGIDFSCRKNITISDSRLAGGVAGGKIVAYRLSANGDSGQLNAEAVIACTIGRGETLITSLGSPDYVVTEYVQENYQFWTDRDVIPHAGELSYYLPSVSPTDDGIDLQAMNPKNCIVSYNAINTAEDQRLAIQALPVLDIEKEYEKVLDLSYTELFLTMKPVTGGPFTTAYPLEVSELMVPKTIDLESAS